MNAPSFPVLEGGDQRHSLTPVMPEEPVLPLTVEGYHALLKAGVLKDGDPVELLEGFLVPKMTKGPRHERARRVLRRQLEKLISDEFFVDEQGALTATTSEPEPDVFVIRGDIEDYSARHAAPAEIALVAEIADSSVRRDRNWKKRVYARAGIPFYWVVNLIDDCIEVFSQPSGDIPKPTYDNATTYKLDDSVPVIIDGKQVGQIAVAMVLGPKK